MGWRAERGAGFPKTCERQKVAGRRPALSAKANIVACSSSVQRNEISFCRCLLSDPAKQNPFRAQRRNVGAWFSPDGEANLLVLVHGSVQVERTRLQALIHEFPKREAKSFFGRGPADKLVAGDAMGDAS